MAFIGAMTVIAFWGGYAWLLGALGDRWNDRAEALEAENPGQARCKAERLVRSLGIFGIQIFNFAAWCAGFIVVPIFAVMLIDSNWKILPVIIVLSITSLIGIWASSILDTLNKKTH